jgi:type I restriction enzyme, S subunit
MNAGWRTRTLGDLCDIKLGRTPSRADKSYWDESRETSNVWLSIADLLDVADGIAVDSREYLSNKGAAISKLVPAGTLLVSFKLTLGRLAFAGRDLYTNEAIAALTVRGEGELLKEYLFYFLHYFDWRAAAAGDMKIKGMTLSKAKLEQISISYPSIQEQKRLVRLLDDSLAHVASAEEHAERNVLNARALLDGQLHTVFSQPAQGWTVKRLGEVCSFENGDRGKNYPSKSVRVQSGVPFINAGHLDPADAEVDFDGMDYISRERFQLLGSGKIRPGDVLFCLRGSLGKVARVGELSEGAIASSLVIVRPSRDVTDSFVLAYFKSHLCAEMIARYANGAAQPNLSAASLAKFVIPLPPLVDQQRIAKRLEVLREGIHQLESIYRQKRDALDQLRRSILHQAFSGA